MITVNISPKHLLEQFIKSHMYGYTQNKHNEVAILDENDTAILVVIRAILPELIPESLTREELEITSNKIRQIHNVLLVLSGNEKK